MSSERTELVAATSLTPPPPIAIFLYAAIYCFGYNSVPLTLISEIFTMRFKTLSMTFCLVSLAQLSSSLRDRSDVPLCRCGNGLAPLRSCELCRSRSPTSGPRRTSVSRTLRLCPFRTQLTESPLQYSAQSSRQALCSFTFAFVSALPKSRPQVQR